MNDPPTHHPDWIAQYDALVSSAGLVELAERTQIELTGADRATFLHNLCTNDVRQLEVGAGCEAFLTSVQGKTLAHVFIFACPDSLVIDTVGGWSDTILKHLDHYLVSEQVTLADRSREWTDLVLAGPGAEPLWARLGDARLPPRLLSHAAVAVAGKRAFLRRIDMTSPGGFLISAAREDGPAIAAALVAAGAVQCGDAAFEAARIERGFPFFGRDISDKNLPQEVGRDQSAISFVKGCYLGQETVARIDALGHVNKRLSGLWFKGAAVPEPGTELLSGERVVGQVTSASYSPRLQAPLALGYVRTGSHAPGTRLTSALGDAEVVPLAGR
ncbi:MAG: glycine cleavage T C-terminal barrel domain-containing protein [Pirellulales bacterium]